MTPYELRFNIFKEAAHIIDNEYQSDYGTAIMWNEDSRNTVKMDIPGYPSFDKIFELAEKINIFVSKTE